MSRQFHIFHATGKDRFQEVKNQPREYVGYVNADSLEEAYMLSQNLGDGDTWNTVNPCRSTSVGDVIQDCDEFHMVYDMGFGILEIEVPEEKEPELEYPQ